MPRRSWPGAFQSAGPVPGCWKARTQNLPRMPWHMPSAQSTGHACYTGCGSPCYRLACWLDALESISHDVQMRHPSHNFEAAAPCQGHPGASAALQTSQPVVQSIAVIYCCYCCCCAWHGGMHHQEQHATFRSSCPNSMVYASPRTPTSEAQQSPAAGSASSAQSSCGAPSQDGDWPHISIDKERPIGNAGAVSCEISIKPRSMASAATFLRPLELEGILSRIIL